MFPPRRAHTALAAAAGVTGIAATQAGDAETSPRTIAPSTLETNSVSAVAARKARLRDRARARKRARKHSFTLLRVKRGKRVALRSRPKGKVVSRVGSRTEFGSRTTFSVAGRRGRWLKVTTSRRKRFAWVDGKSPKLKRDRTRMSIHVDLSSRRLKLLVGGKKLRSSAIGVGAPSSPTPTGRFALTDKLRGQRYRGTYGCCILALNGRQTKLPPGWRGGNRLAIHGGERRSTAGCVRADAAALRALLRRAPVGTPVFVRA
jgi:lipoprotein-anchoring transpeptidase ErfK/SrfK